MTPSILIIYTGGTIGMKQNHETGALTPFNFEQIIEEVPELKKFKLNIHTVSFEPLVDSSEIQPEFWVRLAQMIFDNYNQYDGFVILHGTDTMSYTGSALSFMLENLAKPVVLTGSQLPIGMLRTDGKENLISAIEIAAATKEGKPRVPEVSIFFESQLYRANRTTKYSAEQFDAFRSTNYPPLAEAGIHIKYNTAFIHSEQPNTPLQIHTKLDNNIAVLKIFPGINPNVVRGVLNIPELRAVVLETYGSGNAPTATWFIEMLQEAINRGILILNVSQCQAGTVDMEKYETGIRLKKIGVLSGHDSTTEAAVTKLLFLLGKYKNNEKIIADLSRSFSGEISK